MFENCVCPKCKKEIDNFWDFDSQDLFDWSSVSLIYYIKCPDCGHEFEYREDYILNSARVVKED